MFTCINRGDRTYLGQSRFFSYILLVLFRYSLKWSPGARVSVGHLSCYRRLWSHCLR